MMKSNFRFLRVTHLPALQIQETNTDVRFKFSFGIKH